MNLNLSTKQISSVVKTVCNQQYKWLVSFDILQKQDGKTDQPPRKNNLKNQFAWFHKNVLEQSKQIEKPSWSNVGPLFMQFITKICKC